jgi:glycosyltransferase involved in cell wall biosynthesis
MNPSNHADPSLDNIGAKSMHPDVAVITHHGREETARRAAPSVEPFPPKDPNVARSWVDLPCLPTIVATGPFHDLSHAEQLADAFTAVRRCCTAQLVLLGTGPHRTAVVRRTLAQGVGAHLHVPKTFPAGRWCDFVAAADVVVPSTATGPASLLEVFAIGRAVVAPLDPATVHLVVPNSVGLVYRPGDVPGMAAALLRLLTSPTLRHGMASRAYEVARRHHLEKRLHQPNEGNGYA